MSNITKKPPLYSVVREIYVQHPGNEYVTYKVFRRTREIGFVRAKNVIVNIPWSQVGVRSSYWKDNIGSGYYYWKSMIRKSKYGLANDLKEAIKIIIEIDNEKRNIREQDDKSNTGFNIVTKLSDFDYGTWSEIDNPNIRHKYYIVYYKDTMLGAVLVVVNKKDGTILNNYWNNTEEPYNWKINPNPWKIDGNEIDNLYNGGVTKTLKDSILKIIDRHKNYLRVKYYLP